MTQEMVDTLRAAYEPFARGDFGAYADLPDDFELVLAPEMPDAGTYHGAAARRWLTAWVESFDRLTFEAIDFVDAGDRVVVEFIQRGSPRGSDAAVEVRSWATVTGHDGVLARMELFLARRAALAAAGLRE